MIKFKSKKLDITPEIPSRLVGMNISDKSEGVHSNLEINIMVFNQNDLDVFLVSIDTLFISKELKIFITEEINKIFGNTFEKDILIMSSHTHYAPCLEEKRIELGIKDEDYFSFIKEKIQLLLKNLHSESFMEIEIEVSNGRTINLSCNRRRKVRTLNNYFKQFVAMEPNIKGSKNEELKIIKIYESNNNSKIIGVIWSFPCHLTNLYNKNLVSAEYPGLIRDSVREKQKSTNLPIIYMPGFAGDVRAYPPKRLSLFKILRSILQLSYPIKYYRFVNKVEYDIWVNSIKNSFWLIWNKSEKIIDFKESQLSTKINKKNVAVLGIKVDGVDDVIFRKVNFGDHLGFYTMSAETVSAYSKLIAEISTNNFYICSGYTDEVFGYLPTEDQIKEGGYESNGHFKPFLITGNFNSTIEKTIELCMKEIN